MKGTAAPKMTVRRRERMTAALTPLAPSRAPVDAAATTEHHVKQLEDERDQARAAAQAAEAAAAAAKAEREGIDAAAEAAKQSAQTAHAQAAALRHELASRDQRLAALETESRDTARIIQAEQSLARALQDELAASTARLQEAQHALAELRAQVAGAESDAVVDKVGHALARARVPCTSELTRSC